MEESKISVRLKELDEKEETMANEIRRFQREEETEEMEIFRALSQLEEMREGCSVSDVKILQLLDEQQRILNNIRMEKNEFADEFCLQIHREKESLNEERELLRYQLQKIKEDGE